MSNADLILVEVFIKLIVVLATYLEEDNVLLSVFQPYYMQTPTVFRNGRPTQTTVDLAVDQILTQGDAMYVKAFDGGTIPDTEITDEFTQPSTVTADPAKPNQSLTEAAKLKSAS